MAILVVEEMVLTTANTRVLSVEITTELNNNWMDFEIITKISINCNVESIFINSKKRPPTTMNKQDTIIPIEVKNKDVTT